MDPKEADRIHRLVEQSPDGLFIIVDGRFEFLNEAGLSMFGRDASDLVELYVIDVLDPKEKERLKRNMRLREQGVLRGSVSYTAMHTEGHRFPIEVHAVPMELDGASGLQGVVRDITSRKKMERRLEKTERSSIVSRLASGLAHDFNNLLAVIQANTEIAEREAISPAVKSALKRIGVAVRRGGTQVAHIQQMGTGAGIGGDPQLMHLNPLVEDVVELTRPRWRDEAEALGRRYSICWEPGDAPGVRGVPEDLRAALVALVFNAIESMPAGGPITLRTGTTSSGEAIVVVQDQGEGISENDLARITDPFFTTRPDRQMGLGLHLVRSVAERHGGRLEVDSRLGEGSSVAVLLPSSGEVPVEPAPAPRPVVDDHRSDPTVEEEVRRPRTMGGRRVLLVDDQADLVQVVRTILETRGYEVDLCMKGSEGVELARAVRYSAVLTDLGMPDMSGWEVAAHIRPLQPKTPIILMTGWASKVEPEHVREAGIYGVLPKPFRSEQLLDILSEALDASIDTQRE